MLFSYERLRKRGEKEMKDCVAGERWRERELKDSLLLATCSSDHLFHRSPTCFQFHLHVLHVLMLNGLHPRRAKARTSTRPASRACL